MISKYVETCFNLLVGLVSQDLLIYIALGVAVGLLAWIFLSLAFSTEVKISHNSKNLSRFIEENGINGESEAKIIALVNKMPNQFVRRFKLWQSSNYQTPETYFDQQKCVETPLYGGMLNQNRSVMKSVIFGVTLALFVFSLALMGNESAVTGLSLAQALVIPVLALLVYRIEYYVYTAIRHHYYRIAVENFNELVDVLNEKYEQSEIQLKEAQSVSSVEAFNEAELEEEPNEFEGEDMEEVAQKRGRGRPKKAEEDKIAMLKIENNEDFAKALARAEKLMARLHKPLSDSQKRRTNKELADIMDMMAAFKRKTK